MVATVERRRRWLRRGTVSPLREFAAPGGLTVAAAILFASPRAALQLELSWKDLIKMNRFHAPVAAAKVVRVKSRSSFRDPDARDRPMWAPVADRCRPTPKARIVGTLTLGRIGK